MWYGDDCSLDDVGFAEVVALRNYLLRSLGSVTGMQDVTADSLNQQASSLSSLSADPSQLAGGGELQALGLVGGIASGSESAGLSGGTSDTVGGTISSLLSSGLLIANATTKYSPAATPTAAPTVASMSADAIDAPASAPTVAQRHWRQMRRGRRMILEEVARDGGGLLTFAPTTAFADGAALTAVANAIGSLSAAQLGGAVAGEVNINDDSDSLLGHGAR